MTAPGIRDLLSRTVLEPDFRARVQAGDASALEGYALSEEERSTVLGGGPEVLALLGRLLDPEPPSEPAATEPAPLAEAPPKEIDGPPIRLLLRVMTSAEAGEGPETRLHYAAALLPVPEGERAEDLPPPTQDGVGLPGTRLEDGRLEVVVIPKLSRTEAGLDVRYDYSARMVDVPIGEPAEAVRSIDAAALAAHTSAIKAAPEAERLDLLLALLKQLDANGTDPPDG
ncbi:MAG: hypothetical protein AAGC57_10320 [Pseudomonadota bacterium]